MVVQRYPDNTESKRRLQSNTKRNKELEETQARKEKEMKTKIQKIMSRLYWKERRKGNTHSYAFKNVRIKAIPLKVLNPYGNWDKDNKINKYDCQPKNKWKQDKLKDLEEYKKNIPGIDKEIIPFVKKMNKKGYPTSYSCYGGEGHCEHPLITVTTDNPNSINRINKLDKDKFKVYKTRLGEEINHNIELANIDENNKTEKDKRFNEMINKLSEEEYINIEK